MIKTLDGNTIGKVDDSMDLTEEQVERFKQEHGGMTPEEYAMKQTELAIMYGYRHELPDIIQEVVNRGISYSDICEEVIVKKCSKLRATVRNFIKLFGQTDESKALIQRIIDRQIEILAKQAELVDLGLPSGTLWMTHNVGATKQEEYGKYFAWGDTEGSVVTTDSEGNITSEKKFTWSEYNFGIIVKAENLIKDATYSHDNYEKWSNGTDTYYLKFGSVYTSEDGQTMTQVPNSAYSTTNNVSTVVVLDPSVTSLDSEHDAVTAAYGAGYRMPTKADIEELLSGTTHEWTTINGVAGIKFTNKSKKSKYIFIPAAGDCCGGNRIKVGDNGYIWSSEINSDSVDDTWGLGFNSVDAYVGYDCHYHGYSVRGVFVNDNQQ